MKYTGKNLKEISFPLGGIGTGSIGLAGNGGLIDWEIFNKPSKGSINSYSHFAIKAIRENKTTAYVLNGDLTKDFMGQYEQSRVHSGYGLGPKAGRMCGFPHFKNVEFNGEFPMASLKFTDNGFPAEVTLNAFNPFIPNDAYNSSIPAAFFEIELENITDEKIKYQIAFSVGNPYLKSKNSASEKNGFKLITLSNAEVSSDNTDYGDLTVATDCKNAYSQSYWYRGDWQDCIVMFWNEFSSGEKLKERNYDTTGIKDTCTLTAELELMPNEKKKAKFILSWNCPNAYNYWSESDDEKIRKPWKNYYATIFKDSSDSAVYSLKNWDELYARTLKFKNALHGSSLPEAVIDAAASNLAVLKSPTVLRLEDGSFYGWEGVTELAGSCEGTCQHVWNYAYALCFLFPELERSIRDLEFKYSTDENGKMGFRLMLPLGSEISAFRACVDGQMGAVIKCYREWKLSGDNKWLKDNWENIKKVLEYAWSEKNEDAWDRNKDGVLEGRQHHTLDAELFGPSSWLQGMYLAALKAAADMGEFLGDTKKATEYNEIFKKGFEWTKNNLFNGKYFIQKIDLSDKSLIDKFDAQKYWNSESNQIKYQIGEGSSIDQMLAQWHTDILGLGDIFDKKQISSALSEMMKNNFKPSMRSVVNPWRIFSLNDEAGSVICVYPEGAKKPAIPISYCEETMTGFEYSFAGLLCSQGKLDDGFKVVKAIRDRFDGEKRNPWNEFECGSNYARSMASYALIPILSGFEFDLPNKHIGFNPYQKDNFSCIWSISGAWGTFKIKDGKVTLSVLEGKLTLTSFGAGFCEKISNLIIDGKNTEYKFFGGAIHFKEASICKEMEFEI